MPRTAHILNPAWLWGSPVLTPKLLAWLACPPPGGSHRDCCVSPPSGCSEGRLAPFGRRLPPWARWA